MNVLPPRAAAGSAELELELELELKLEFDFRIGIRIRIAKSWLMFSCFCGGAFHETLAKP